MFKEYRFVVFSVVAIGITGFILHEAYLELYDNPPRMLGETIGKSLFYAFLGFFLANRLRKRWKRTRLEFCTFCFSVSFYFCAILGIAKANREINYMNKAKQEMARLAGDFSNEVLIQESTKDYSRKDYGDLAIFFTIRNQLSEFSRKMRLELDEAGLELEDVLSLNTICNSELIIQAKVKVKKFSDKLDECERKYNEEFARTKLMLEKTSFEDYKFRNGALRGFEDGRIESQSLITKCFHIERCAAQCMDDLLNFFFKIQGLFWELDNSLFFINEIDEKTFILLMENFQKIEEEEIAITQRLEDYEISVRQNMENLFKN